MLARKDLHGYQEKAVTFIKNNASAALWVDMGLGKTVACLTALDDLIEAKLVKKALIIAPLRVAKHTWPHEIKNWEHLERLKYRLLAGLSAEKRLEGVSAAENIHIINRENIPWLVNIIGQKWHYDCVVIDESSSFKSHSSKRWKAMRKVLGKINRMIHLTGTPAPNSLLELWPQIYLLDKGKRLGNTRGKFLEKYCQSVGNPSWNQWQVKKEKQQDIYQNVNDLVLRLDAKDYIKLPSKLLSNVNIHLNKKAEKIYNDMKKEFIVSFENGDILAVNVAVQINKLLQIANGCLYAEKGYELIHKEKIEALVDIVSTATEPLLVAYNYKSDLQQIKKAIPNAVVLDKKPETIERWNQKKIDVLLCHPASAGHGLNLQHGGNVIIWFGLMWSLELYEQFNARLYRQGQSKPVRIIHILADKTADMRVLETLQSKKESQNALLDFVADLKKSIT